jgi:hypothetical protein
MIPLEHNNNEFEQSGLQGQVPNIVLNQTDREIITELNSSSKAMRKFWIDLQLAMLLFLCTLKSSYLLLPFLGYFSVACVILTNRVVFTRWK